MEHPAVTAHEPRLLLLTPPPIDEYQIDPIDLLKGYTTPQRAAQNTKHYADASREVGESLGIPVVDLWTAFMIAAGWQEGQPLTGSKQAARSDVLENLLVDGKLMFSGWILKHSDGTQVCILVPTDIDSCTTRS